MKNIFSETEEINKHNRKLCFKEKEKELIESLKLNSPKERTKEIRSIKCKDCGETLENHRAKLIGRCGLCEMG